MANMGTRLYTRFKGRLVGKDEAGRAYYESRKPTRTGGGELRHERWVIYHKGEDGSAVPPEWWGWLHHVDAQPIPQSDRKPWQLPPQANLTGTAGAWHPPGSALRGGKRPPASGDYAAWTPEE
ncbi:NADH-ubiquinone oxidoreductase subunit NDUFA12 family protein [Acetobacter sp. AN02]|uniref:NADH-ubiquinone oxidoreductase subunit NDUFA12 family protein n=1 Tax=Acetobacter sp. AN02 TaxID=2894186 RepID=UPI0024344A29|nr:NADH-ubiquinone oxidoreductase subunit NDUFA12 family protein [Acetobacter sp. AN02]MDG6095410.1 NADH-ubiquinone oxidoreductase subunit NDUFA12 family protein [Acetobacter sp. AN02]